MAEEKHLTLQELLLLPDFKEIGEYEDNINADELTEQVAKEWAKVNEEFKTKGHGNNYVWYKFKFLDQPNSHLLPQGYNNFGSKTDLAHWTSDALGQFYSKGNYPKLNETTVNALGVLLNFEDNKEAAKILAAPSKYKIHLGITLTSREDRDRPHKGKTEHFKVDLTPCPYAIEDTVYCWSLTFIEPNIRFPTDTAPYYELQPASVDILKRAANLHGTNETRDKTLTKDKYFLGKDGFEAQVQNSMTFFFKEPPAQEIMPRVNLYHPEDHHKEVEDRRLIASFKTTVKCFKPDVLNVCPDCKEDRQGAGRKDMSTIAWIPGLPTRLGKGMLSRYDMEPRKE